MTKSNRRRAPGFSAAILLAVSLVGCRQVTQLKLEHPWIQGALGPKSLSGADAPVREVLLWALVPREEVGQYRVAWVASREPEPWIWVTSNVADGARVRIKLTEIRDRQATADSARREYPLELIDGFASVRLTGLPAGTYHAQLFQDESLPPLATPGMISVPPSSDARGGKKIVIGAAPGSPDR